MFDKALLAAKLILTTTGSLFDESKPHLIDENDLPESYTISQLYELLTGGGNLNEEYLNNEKCLLNFFVLARCLNFQQRLLLEDGDGDHIQGLLLWISKASLPRETSIFQHRFPTGSQLSSEEKQIQVNQDKAIGGLESIGILVDLRPPAHIHNEVLLTMIVHSIPSRFWSTARSRNGAQNLLLKYGEQCKTKAFIVDFLMEGVLRPLFSKTKRPDTITESGRQAMPSSAPPARFTFSDENIDTEPWKMGFGYPMAIFRWAVENLPEGLFSKHRNYFIPPIVILLDDKATPILVQGFVILTSLLPHLSSKTLLDTGLGEVFEDAIMPKLMYLPNLTPAEESLELLPPAYTAVRELCLKRFESNDMRRFKFLNRILRDGVLSGYVLIQENASIVELLIKELGTLVQLLGLHAVSNLTNMLEIVSKILCDPFGHAHANLMLETLRTTKIIILDCWPRLSDARHRIALITILVHCCNNPWVLGEETLHSAEDLDKDQKDKEAVRRELKTAASLLATVLQTSGADGELRAILDALDSRQLRFVFDPLQTPELFKWEE